MLFSSNYSISKVQKQNQSILYAANYINNIMRDTNHKVFAISSTLKNLNTRKFIINQVSRGMINTYNYKVLNCFCSVKDCSEIEYINENSVDSVVNVSLKNLENVLKENYDKYDVIFVMLEPVNVFADALSCAKLCDSIIMIERYLYTKYNKFEKSLMYLKNNDINVAGVITYR